MGRKRLLKNYVKEKYIFVCLLVCWTQNIGTATSNWKFIFIFDGPFIEKGFSLLSSYLMSINQSSSIYDYDDYYQVQFIIKLWLRWKVAHS